MADSLEYDYLIIGSGLAGMFAAIKASQKYRVALLTKETLEECNSVYAQGGISCVMESINDGDSFASHTADTLMAGAGLCNEEAVRQIVSEAPERIQDLIDLGVHFTRRGEVENELTDNEKSDYDLGKEGGHSKRRILHAGDVTGAELIRALKQNCLESENIDIYEHHQVIDLITTAKLDWSVDDAQTLGAYALDVKSEEVKTFLAKSTILATGGAGKVYRYTTNPDIATGDGLGIAYRAGAQIANMEFFQFHPTCLYHHDLNSFLVSEAVRGEGAVLKVRRKGELVAFMDDYHELKSLAPRDIVARAIDKELKQTGEACVYLDITHHDEAFLKKRFPTIFETCLSVGINMSTDLVPVVPAAHYCCGGVKTDINGATNLSRLYAIGEAASTGLHGANRLASNSLLEAIVLANNAVASAETEFFSHLTEGAMRSQYNAVPEWTTGNAKDSDELVIIAHNWQEIRTFMWDYVGIFRTTNRLQRAKRRIRTLQHEIAHYYWDFTITKDLIELRNIASVAELIIDSALSRKESRGLHYNKDYPEKLEKPQDTLIQKY